MKDILTEILAHKQKEIAVQQATVPASFLESQLEILPPAHSMKQSLIDSPTGIIAEFKRRSPSKDWINRTANASLIPLQYAKAGAAAVSILTDEQFFGGGLQDIREARPLINIPILRKDFVISYYQLLQAKVTHADAILLIAAALSEKECRTLAYQAHELQLEVLLEVHHENELGHINEYIDMIGINNRNLKTFHTDIDNSFQLAQLLPKDRVLVSESGISSPDIIRSLRQTGFQGFLIGETFMKTAEPGNTLQQFIKNIAL